MARRKTARRPVSKAMSMAFSDAHEKLFRLGEGWSPPATVQVRHTAKGATLVAIFRDDQDQPVRLTTRVAWVRGQDRLAVVEEGLSKTYRLGGQS